MKQVIHLKSIISAWVRGSVRYSPVSRVFLLIPILFACIALSQAARAANPGPSTRATNPSRGVNDGVRNFRNTPLIGPQPTIITFDGPGSGTGPGEGTIAFAINPAGTISGRYADAGGAIHAILRYPNGAIIAFDAPGAGTGPRQGTRPFSINPAGATAGYYNDASGVFHGFLRTPDGVITTFNVPGAGTAPGEGTFAGNINPLAAIAGRYVDANDVAHGFLRTPDGTFTMFDAPNAGTGPGQGTFLPGFASIPQGRSRELRLTRAMCITACYALRTALSPRSTFRARAQASFKAHSRSGSTRPERLRETILTRVM